MGQLFELPTDQAYDWSRRWISAGGAVVGLAVCVLIGLALKFEGPLTGVPSQIAGWAGITLVYGLSALLWGLRIPAQEYEYQLVARTGYTPPYSLGCAALALVLALSPFLVFAVSHGWIGPAR